MDKETKYSKILIFLSIIFSINILRGLYSIVTEGFNIFTVENYFDLFIAIVFVSISVKSRFSVSCFANEKEDNEGDVRSKKIARNIICVLTVTFVIYLKFIVWR